MSQSVKQQSAIDITVENIGGIDETSMTLEPGVTVLAGRNATNRTSLMRAIMGGLGSDDVSVKGDADRGRVSLTIGDTSYEREFVPTDDGVAAVGDDGIDDVATAELFAFLLENNDARRAIELGADLRELVLRPVDFEALEEQIASLEADRQSLADRLDELDALEDQLLSLEETKRQYGDDLEAVEAELADKTTELEEYSTDAEGSTESEAELEALFDDLREVRREAAQVDSDIEIERESIDSLEDELAEREASLEGIDGGDGDDPAELRARIDDLREQRRQVEGDLTTLQRVQQLVQEMRDGELFESVDHDTADTGSVTDQLVSDAPRRCLVCTSSVTGDELDEAHDHIRDLAGRTRGEVQELEAEIASVTDRLEAVEGARREREAARQRVDALTDELETRRDRLETLTARAEELEDERDRLEAAIDELESDQNERVIELSKTVNRLELEADRLTDNIDQVEAAIDDIGDQLDERSDIEAQREVIGDELVELRSHVRQIEEELVEAFNHHMDQILSLLEFENIERIWIQRLGGEADTPTAPRDDVRFEVNVARSDDAGHVYSDAVEHLSESERKVTGLIFALAGYLVHDVHETVPVMLLDSLEAIDAERIDAIVGYFHEYTPFLVVALLPEDATAVEGDYRVVEHQA